MSMTKSRQKWQKLDGLECGKWQKCPFCHDFGNFGGQKILLISKNFRKINKFLEGLKFRKFRNLWKCCIIIEFLFFRNNHSNSNSVCTMQGLSGHVSSAPGKLLKKNSTFQRCAFFMTFSSSESNIDFLRQHFLS